MVRRSVELRRLQSTNEVAGFIIAVVGVLYAVLLAFMVVIQWEGFASARTNANAESSAIGNLYRDAVALGPAGRQLAGAVDVYARRIAYSEYPYVAKHQKEDPNIDGAFNGVWKAVVDLRPSTPIAQNFARQTVSDLSTAAETRRTRIDDSNSTLPVPLWIVMLVGGALTIGFTYFFGLESFGAQATMVSTLAVIIGLCLFVILDLDLPFTGDIAIKPTAIQSELSEFCSYNFVNPEQGRNCRASGGAIALPPAAQ